MAEHWSDVGQPNAPDSELLSYARGMNAVLLTHDLDFGAILAQSGEDGPSVVQFREQETSPSEMGILLLAAVDQCHSELESGALVTIDFSRAKARILPIRR